MADRNYLVLNYFQNFQSSHETESDAEKQAVTECEDSDDVYENTFYVVKIIGKAERPCKATYTKVAPAPAKPKATRKVASK